MGRLEFVDSHVHYWDLGHPDLYYSWLQPDSVHPQLGERLDGIKGVNFVAEDFITETRDANEEIIAAFSQDEQTAMFSGNAERLYRI